MKFVDKEKVGQSFALLCIAAVFFFCTFSSVQTFLRTGILWKMNQKLTEYGEKIDGFQTSVSEMRDDLSKQQEKIISAQSNLNNIEYWVQNLYGKMTNEMVSTGDTNRVLALTKTNGLTVYVVRLEHAAIPGSVQASFRVDASFDGGYPQQRLSVGSCVGNIVSFRIPGIAPPQMFLDYVVDSRQTNLYRLPSPSDLTFTNEGFFLP